MTSPAGTIDAHAHLDDRRFDADRDEVIARASAAGVTRILSCGEDIASSERNIEIALLHGSVRVAAGIHPHRAESWDRHSEARLRVLAHEPRVVAIGEIGVDLSGRSAPRDAQIRAFSDQLRVAREVELPVVVHVRDAGPLAREIVDRAGPVRGMIHCFSERPDDADEWLRRGFAISFAGTLTYPTNANLREAAARIPADRLLVETDAPYLAPQRRRGERNEPAFVLETLAAVAAARAEPVERVAEAVSAAAGGLFGPRWR